MVDAQNTVLDGLFSWHGHFISPIKAPHIANENVSEWM